MKKNNNWYSVLVAVLVSGFIIMLTTWILRLVIAEARDTNWYESYLKAYYWAEAWVELWLLAYNSNNLDIYESTKDSDISGVLWDDYNLPVTYKVDAFNTSVTDITIWAWEYHMIKLWDSTSDLTLSSDGWDDLVWNFLGSTEWIYSTWDFDINTNWKKKTYTLSNDNLWLSDISVWNFLLNSDENVLILFNTWTSEITYSFNANVNFEFGEWRIIWSWKDWNYKQNLRVKLNNAEGLNFLKYSIYLPE